MSLADRWARSPSTQPLSGAEHSQRQLFPGPSESDVSPAKKKTNKKQQQKKKMKSNRPLAEAPEAPGKHGAPGRGHGPTCWWLLEAFRTLHRSTCDSTKPGCSRHFSGSGPPHSTTEGLMEEAARHTPLPVYKSSAFLASFLKESSKTT